MEVILLQKVRNLGDLGDKVKVRPGYGRNLLIPNGMALPATVENLKVFEQRRSELEKLATDSIGAAKSRAQSLEGLKLVVKARAADEGKLYGSVGPYEIVEGFKSQGLTVAKREIQMLEGPIRRTGEHRITLLLHSDVEIGVTVIVEEEKEV